MRIALAQINTTVGDIHGNRDLVLDWVRRAEGSGADLVVFPELSVMGYPPRDLLPSVMGWWRFHLPCTRHRSGGHPCFQRVPGRFRPA
jgi:hypothetical protein